jgi:hypothetical protein
MSGEIDLSPVHATLLQGTAALNCLAGVIGGTSGGQAKDTVWYGYIIGKNATAATLTVTGLHDSSATLQSMVLNGSTTADVPFWFPEPILNEFAALTFQPSAAGLIWVFTRAYIGPESPQ